MASGLSLGPAHVEERARAQLFRQLVNADLIVALRRLLVVAFVEVKISADQTCQRKVFMVRVLGSLTRDEGGGKLAQIFVIQQVEAVELPVSRSEGFLGVGVVLLDHQVDFNSTRIALAHAVGVADEQQHLRTRGSWWQDFGVLVVVVDDAVVIALGIQRLNDAHEGDAAVLLARFRHAQRLFKHHDGFFRLLELGIKHGCTNAGFGDDGAVAAGLDEFVKNGQRLGLFVLTEVDAAERQQ